MSASVKVLQGVHARAWSLAHNGQEESRGWDQERRPLQRHLAMEHSFVNRTWEFSQPRIGGVPYNLVYKTPAGAGRCKICMAHRPSTIVNPFAISPPLEKGIYAEPDYTVAVINCRTRCDGLAHVMTLWPRTLVLVLKRLAFYPIDITTHITRHTQYISPRPVETSHTSKDYPRDHILFACWGKCTKLWIIIPTVILAATE
jgi:hypothetical protein